MNSIAYSSWQGQWKSGKGSISTRSGILNEQPFTFATRFEEPPGAGSEEMLAAAHASCINQALSNVLGQDGFTADIINTKVEIVLGRDNNEKLMIQSSKINLEARIPGITEEIFFSCAEKAKNGCTISRVLNCPIDLKAILL
jgi:osmotically inducible protein OsmC